jgi:hypothetical protein
MTGTPGIGGPVTARRLTGGPESRRRGAKAVSKVPHLRLGTTTAIGLALLVSGCGLSPQAYPTPLNRRSVPSALLRGPARTTTTVVGVPMSDVTIYLEGASQHLVTVRRRVPSPATVTEVLDALTAGPTASESDRGLVSPASSVGALVAGPSHKEVVPVNVPVSFESLGGQDQVMVAAQVVYSLTGLPRVRGVVFLVGGQRTQVPNDNGSVKAGPLTRLDYAALR